MNVLLNRTRRALVLGGAMLLAACAHNVAPPRAGETVASGRFAVNLAATADRPADSAQGRFDWRERSENSTLTLYSPLGQTIAEIVDGGGQAELRLPGEAPRIAADADSLVAERLGLPLPVNGLRYWLHGHAAPWSPSRERSDGPADSRRLEQDGWTIDYRDRAGPPGFPSRRIDLRRELDGRPVDLRLVLDLPDPDTPPPASRTQP